ncbi:DUF4962 domain-containing protein [Janthinobacterium fluminis]|uniref:DUF4962 domain-containing protein n=1 Tax=Janthinobacterium fluminis TaxID=2987524 RepID=A0ABT5JXZ5_9BURK|nr:DUF4962 domain-containing protein [Janthinobacterium fluminis]MDC8757614.1 DUF4962 domain-containing protein [Janthinobacterium fluminis]
MIKPTPDFLQVQPQNPPSFAWARHRTLPPSYTVELSSGGVVVATYTSTRGFLLPSKALPAGTYSWRVRPSTVVEWSTPRTFVINATSKVFEVPESPTIRAAALLKARPRQLPPSVTRKDLWPSAMLTARSAALTTLTNQVETRMLTTATIADTMWPLAYASTTLTAAKSDQQGDLNRKIDFFSRQLESASLLYYLTGNTRYLNEALWRGDQLAGLDPVAGPTSYVNQDQLTRKIALSMIKAVDFLTTNLGAERKARWLSNVNVRAGAFYADLSRDNGRLDQTPFDSHGGNTLGFLALIATLSLGDIPEANNWFDFSYRAYLNAVFAWSGPEGGFANGTAYAEYTCDAALQVWQPLGQATGVSLFDKPWSVGFMQFFMHFEPPGAAGHVFGDEHEIKPMVIYPKAFAGRVKSANAAWYYQNLAGAEDALSLVQAPYPLPSSTITPVAPPDAALYPSIGWVAMHSSMTTPKRTSVFFKSSPYGSYNHSHADQNGLVIDSGGRRLLTEAGYSDYFYSPLAVDWYRTTKAHNAITFDGGIGQIGTEGVKNLGRNGKITAFSTTPTLDFAEGDATPAYNSDTVVAMKSAIRKVWYLRDQDVVVVLDRLDSPLARKYEWNLHAAAPINLGADGVLQITNVDRSLCIKSLINDSAAPYTTRPAPPPKAGTFEAHGAFVKAVANYKAEFLVVLDVGCKRPVTTLTTLPSGARSLKIGTRELTLPSALTTVVAQK